MRPSEPQDPGAPPLPHKEVVMLLLGSARMAAAKPSGDHEDDGKDSGAGHFGLGAPER